jgi:hypothetical protein
MNVCKISQKKNKSTFRHHPFIKNIVDHNEFLPTNRLNSVTITKTNSEGNNKIKYATFKHPPDKIYNIWDNKKLKPLRSPSVSSHRPKYQVKRNRVAPSTYISNHSTRYPRRAQISRDHRWYLDGRNTRIEI